MCFCLRSKKSSANEKEELDEFFPLCPWSWTYRLGQLEIYGNCSGKWMFATRKSKKLTPNSYFVARDGKYTDKEPKGSAQHWKPCERGKVFESLIDSIFLSTEGELDYFQVLFEKGLPEHEELQYVGIDRVREFLNGRPIKTKLFHQISSNIYLNSDDYKYWREYVDFSMYFANSAMYSGDELELTEKILKCEFLFLRCVITNPECLGQFMGWGLIVGHAEKNHLSFQSIHDILMDWYSGKQIAHKYYLLQFDKWDFPEEIWNEILSISKEINHVPPMHLGTEYEITRKDGAKCMVGKDECTKSAYFYLGETRKELYEFGARVALC